MSKIAKFVKENSLRFDGRGSGLNSDCCVISGFADYCGVHNVSDVETAIKEGLDKKSLSPVVLGELRRVFQFASTYNYGNYWKTAEAKRMYKF